MVLRLGTDAVHPRTKKERLIFDARHLNSFLWKPILKMESLHVEGRDLCRMVGSEVGVEASEAAGARGIQGEARAGEHVQTANCCKHAGSSAS